MALPNANSSNASGSGQTLGAGQSPDARAAWNLELLESVV